MLVLLLERILLEIQDGRKLMIALSCNLMAVQLALSRTGENSRQQRASIGKTL